MTRKAIPLARRRGSVEHVLITGPCGVGKSTLARFFRDQGKNAFDADDVPGLAEWVDLKGNPKRITRKEWRTMEGILFFWNADRLENLLRQEKQVFLFGSADNLYEFLPLFDRRIYLLASRATIAERLAHPARDNDFGRDEPQRSLILSSLRDDVKKARRAGFEFVDASMSPQQVFDRVCGPNRRSHSRKTTSGGRVKGYETSPLRRNRS